MGAGAIPSLSTAAVARTRAYAVGKAPGRVGSGCVMARYPAGQGLTTSPERVFSQGTLHYVLLLEHDLRELAFVETTLRRASRRDIVLLHEAVLSAGLLLLQGCRVQLILFDPALRDGRLDETLSALRLRSPGTPIVLLQRTAGQGTVPHRLRLLLRLPRGVHAIVSHGDSAGLLRTLEAILGPDSTADS
jgi:hypothetical protein